MRKKALLYGFVSVVAAAMIAAAPALRAGGENINFSDINKIKAEGMQRSQVMELCSWLSDVYAPRLTGSPASMKAAQWTVAKMKEWGFSNVAIEPWVNRNGFERGWTNDKFYMAVVSPEPFPIPGTPTAWTPGTAGPVSGDVVLVTAATEDDLAAYKGKLKGKWVLTQEAPDVPAMWQPQASRYTREELAAMEVWPAPPAEFGVTPPAAAGRGGAPAPAAAPQGAPPQAAGQSPQAQAAQRPGFDITRRHHGSLEDHQHHRHHQQPGNVIFKLRARAGRAQRDFI
ncbi:MAG: hypothetical protein EHM24_27470 [Acidobacteria bacterium]|nr:MAG: hypothetical protein EHM24_27470 [Acidobacteriota bacterium]